MQTPTPPLPRRYLIIGITAVVALCGIWAVASRKFSEPPALKLFQKEGEVLFTGNGEAWEIADANLSFISGETVRSGERSKAIFKDPDGSYIRLFSSTQVGIDSITSQSVNLTIPLGKTFQRIPTKGDNHTHHITALSHSIQLNGGAFDLTVNNQENRLNLRVIEGSASVTISNTSTPILIDKGKEITVDSKNNFTLTDIPADYAKSDWFLWNQSEDQKIGYSLALPHVSATPSTETPTTTSTPQKPSTTKTTTTRSPLGTTTSPTVSGTCRPSVSAKRGLNNIGFQLNWTPCKSDDFQFYKVVRSTTNPNPSYPSSPALVSSNNRNLSSYLDKNIALGATYYYRVCVVERLNVVGCGNVAKITN
jgi:hypothetical protein